MYVIARAACVLSTHPLYLNHPRHDGYFFALEYDKSNKLHNGKYKQNQRCPGSSEAVANKTACAKAATALGKGWSSSSIVKWTNHQAGCIGGDGGAVSRSHHPRASWASDSVCCLLQALIVFRTRVTTCL